VQFLLRQADPCSGRYKSLGIDAVGCDGIVVIFKRNRTFISWFITSIADKGSFADPPALFEFKGVTDFIADMTRAADSIAEKELFAGIFLAASKPVNTKVVRIVKTAPIPRIGDPVFKHLIRNGRGILAEILGDSAEGLAFV